MIADELCSIYGNCGAGAYFGEPVTVTEHSLQTAYLAARTGTSDGLVLAALLHDVGHLIEAVPGDIADWKSDAGHERVGSQWLASHFSPQICEPVRLHVPAKRYLCAVDPLYFEALSPASVVTLRLQGGPMSASEAAAFEAKLYFRDAVQLRRWDDEAKVAGLPVPDFAHYRTLIEQLAIA